MFNYLPSSETTVTHEHDELHGIIESVDDDSG